jgi:RNA polymerase sigma factor (sigma-70 family)
MKAIETEVPCCELSTLFEVGATGRLSDGELLERFVSRRDEAAFEAIVRRHGPLVWGACRRILRGHHDAEDAFQATFIVLARRADSITPREMLPNWLYGVARQSAGKARALLRQREQRERQVTRQPEPAVASSSFENELRDVIDVELSRLPAAYRASIVLCHLEGKGHQEAAEQLGWPVGTLSGRLSRARTMLAKRLSRRGVVLSTVALEALSNRHASAEPVGASLIRTAVDSAQAFMTASASSGPGLSQAAALAKGVLRAMLLRKIKIGTLLAVPVTLIGLGLVALAGDDQRQNGAKIVAVPAEQPPTPGQRSRGKGSAALLEQIDWALTGVDAGKRRISAMSRWTWNMMANDEFANSSLRTGLHLSFKDLPVAKDAEILIDGKPGTLQQLEVNKETFQARYGRQLVLKLSEDGSTITRIDARSQNSYFYLQGVDVQNRVIAVSIGASGRLAQQLELHLARNARIVTKTEKNRAKAIQLTDLKPGMPVSLELGAEAGQIVVLGLQAQE